MFLCKPALFVYNIIGHVIKSAEPGGSLTQTAKAESLPLQDESSASTVEPPQQDNKTGVLQLGTESTAVSVPQQSTAVRSVGISQLDSAVGIPQLGTAQSSNPDYGKGIKALDY